MSTLAENDRLQPGGVSLENGRKTGLGQDEIREGFWPHLRTKQNGASRRFLRSCVHPRPAHHSLANSCKAGICGETGRIIVIQVKELGSGAGQREKLLEPARHREIEVMLVWRLDHWGRSVTDLLATLQELEHGPPTENDWRLIQTGLVAEPFFGSL
jgi:hypothetical protein